MNLLKSDCVSQATARPGAPVPPPENWQSIAAAFGLPLAVIDVESGEVVDRSEGLPPLDAAAHWPECREAARRGAAELIDERDPIWLLALPIPAAAECRHVALLPLVGRALGAEEDLAAAGLLLGFSAMQAGEWAARQPVWPLAAALRMAAAVSEPLRAARRIGQLENEIGHLSRSLTETYEEISLLHRLTENLRLSQSDEEMARIALEWLEEVVPAECLAIYLSPADHSGTLGSGSEPENVFLSLGHCPIEADEFAHLAQAAWEQFARPGQPLVLNRGATKRQGWPCAAVREAIFVPLAEGKNRFGWIGALNRTTAGEFGSTEASLLGSVAALLGIHSGNILLYQQQAELTAGIIRALTEAIDAKDQYTCGHSNRVARIAVRLAQEMNCDLPTVNSVYLAGLLHDVGKIGIMDGVLRKPAELTPDEYEHIKMHPAIGHRILRDIKKIEHILPAILHHHESWNGAGYPQQLAADDIPLTARIVAVADSYDAMGSDRPYRKGMPRERIAQIFRDESGVQWDPQVVAAFFRAEADLQAIVNDQRRELSLNFAAPAD